jgi:hypothetical protein
MLDKLEDILRGQGLVKEHWADDIKAWGEDVALARQYYRGDHRTFLTQEMKDILRSQEGFRDNYCELVINTMVDRLSVRGVATEDEAANDWAQGVMRTSRFDALQLDVHQAVVRDGDAFVMVGYDEDAQAVSLHFEEAWDNVEGVIPVYDRMRKHLVAAVKVWYETDYRRVNVYYPDRVSKYMVQETDVGDNDSAEGYNLVPYEVDGEPQIDLAWAVGAIPLIHYKNRAGARTVYGVSELRSAIPLQDVLNRVLVSMVTTGEMSAFPIRYALGMGVPAKLSPGMWIESPDPLVEGERIELGTMEQANMDTFIQQAAFVIDQIGTVTLTPLPQLMGGAGDSGEALKERQTGLTGKVERAQVRLGNAWEDLMALAALTHNTYTASGRVDEAASWAVRWKDAQQRNHAEMLAFAKDLREAGYEREYLRTVGAVMGWDEDKIDQLEREKREQEADTLAMLGGSAPGFEQFTFPAAGD